MFGDAARAAQPVGVVGRDADDLAEPERDDGEVVAAQSQRRRAEQHAGGHGHAMPIGATARGQVAVGRAEHADRVRADGEEGDVAEVEQAGLADDDVQPDRHQHVAADGVEEHARRSRSSACRGSGSSRLGQDGSSTRDEARMPATTRPARQLPPPADELDVARHLRPSADAVDDAHARALPSDSPSRPVGRNIRTRTSTTKAIGSFHWCRRWRSRSSR